MDESTKRIREKLVRELGPEVNEALADSQITEVMLNSDGKIWVEHFSEGMKQIGTMSEAKGRSLLATIASSLNTQITENSPSVEGELILDGTPRIAGSIPPKTTAPQLTIRKHSSKIFTLDEYVEQDSLTPMGRVVLKAAVKNRLNILVCGGTGSGKTTLVNSLINEMSESCPSDRIYILEDTREIQCKSQNKERFKTSPAESMEKLVMSSLRHRPDRIVVGEVRDGAALSLLEAWNTGHEGGVATIHARKTSVNDALLRIDYLTQKALPGVDHGMLISSSVDLIVTIERQGRRRAITSITEVKGYDSAKREYQTQSIDLEVKDLIKKVD